MRINKCREEPVRPGGTRREPNTLFSQVQAPSPASVTTAISEEARERLLTTNGKNAASPAQRAKEMMAGYEALGVRNFGQLVSTIARHAEMPSAQTAGDATPAADPTGAGSAEVGETPPANEGDGTPSDPEVTAL